MDNLYLWKARNDKLVRGNDRDPLELIRYAQGECQVWFTENEPNINFVQTPIATSQSIRLENICLVDSSWTFTSIFSGCGWKWLNNTGWTKLMGIRNQTRR